MSDDWLGKTFWLRFKVGKDPDPVSCADGVQRVRHALKYMLRALGLKNEGLFPEDAVALKPSPKPARKPK